MKKLLMSCLSLVMMAACTTTPADEMLDSENSQSVNVSASENEALPEGKRRVRFVVNGLSVNITKASLAEASVHHLYIYEGETLLLQQTDTEAGDAFGSPSLVLDYGSHTLTFVASEYELDDTDNQVRSGNTFSARKTVTVDENTTTQSVIMARIKTGLRIVINDSPANLARLNKITLVLTNPYINLLPGNQVATAPHSGTIYISCDVPQTTPAALTLYTFCPSFTEVFNQVVTMVMKDKDTNTLLCNKTVTAPLLMNRITEVRGTWLTTETLFTVNTEWGEEEVINN